MSVIVETEGPPRAGRREWAGLAVLALPVLLLALDNSVLFLALPRLGADLAPSATQMLWIIDVYGFLMAGFLVTMGAVGDRVGRRRLLLVGSVAFGGASVLAAYAPSAGALIVARALLGLAAATLLPSTLALVTVLFRDARQRAFAIGVFSACFMGGAALGPVIGGLLLEAFWWGSVFLMAVPVMVLLLVAAPLLLPADGERGNGRIDPVSVVLSLAAVLPLVYGLKEAAAEPGRVTAYAAMAAGLVFGVLFVRRQRAAADPMLDVALFRDRTFSTALGILVVGTIVQSGVYLFVSQYLQLVEGMAPLRAGLWMAPPALALVAGSLATPLVARRVRPGIVVATGLVLTAAGFGAAMWTDSPATMTVAVTVGFLGASPLGVLGMDLVVGSAPRERAGSASAVAEMSGEFGVALGVATLGSLGAAVYRASAPEEGGASLGEAAAARLPAEAMERAREAFMDGLAAVAGVSAALVLVLAVVGAALLRHLRPIGEKRG
ncbi:MFS transporter [Actinomadura kijaniata]|uniref:DHA2 family multidrug resistance protein-like MFS transporter n=1 Tax=Actinomadura namibiensis TaxID=182080 RepID=A0A7W3LN43_ACTNM|nr:MFS transporter [Actinomadura namibiensis]MBA8951198.1 DHA2 family multidrug resistance protein-like MFS transporter [Actinomadura namibiensis]